MSQSTPAQAADRLFSDDPTNLCETALAVLRELAAIQSLVKAGGKPDEGALALQRLMTVLPSPLYSLWDHRPALDYGALFAQVARAARRYVSVDVFDCPSATEAVLHTGLRVLHYFELGRPFAWCDRARRNVVSGWPWSSPRLFDDGTKLIQKVEPVSVAVGGRHRLEPLIIDFPLSSSDLANLRSEVEAEVAVLTKAHARATSTDPETAAVTRLLSPKHAKKWWAEHILLCGRNNPMERLAELGVYYEEPGSGVGLCVDLNGLTNEQRQRYDRQTKVDVSRPK